VRLGGIFPAKLQAVVEDTLRGNCEAYRISEVAGSSTGISMGIVGKLLIPVFAEELIANAKEVFDSEKIRVSSNYSGMKISRLAVISGSGSSMLSKAVAMGANAVVTADCRQKDFLYAIEQRVMLLCPTHFKSEYCFVDIVNDAILGEYTNVPIYISKTADMETIV
jgi:putative NIF3 family GTP cyclohydrolase 1 type 2